MTRKVTLCATARIRRLFEIATEHIDSVSSDSILELTPDTSATKNTEDTLVETYKGVGIYQRNDGYYVGVYRFSNLGAAKRHIDGFTSDQGQD